MTRVSRNATWKLGQTCWYVPEPGLSWPWTCHHVAEPDRDQPDVESRINSGLVLVHYHMFIEMALFSQGCNALMMTSSNVTGPSCGKFIGHRWIPLTKASDEDLWCFLWSAPEQSDWVNNRETGGLRRHRTHYDVMLQEFLWSVTMRRTGMPRPASMKNSCDID